MAGFALNPRTREQEQPGWRNLPVEVRRQQRQALVNERGLRHFVPPKIQLGAADYAAQNGAQATNQLFAAGPSRRLAFSILVHSWGDQSLLPHARIIEIHP
jgi:hypothetical protein